MVRRVVHPIHLAGPHLEVAHQRRRVVARGGLAVQREHPAAGPHLLPAYVPQEQRLTDPRVGGHRVQDRVEQRQRAALRKPDRGTGNRGGPPSSRNCRARAPRVRPAGRGPPSCGANLKSISRRARSSALVTAPPPCSSASVHNRDPGPAGRRPSSARAPTTARPPAEPAAAPGWSPRCTPGNVGSAGRRPRSRRGRSRRPATDIQRTAGPGRDSPSCRRPAGSSADRRTRSARSRALRGAGCGVGGGGLHCPAPRSTPERLDDTCFGTPVLRSAGGAGVTEFSSPATRRHCSSGQPRQSDRRVLVGGHLSTTLDAQRGPAHPAEADVPAVVAGNPRRPELNSREVVLGRIRAALAADTEPPPPVPREYIRVGSDPPGSEPVLS